MKKAIAILSIFFLLFCTVPVFGENLDLQGLDPPESSEDSIDDNLKERKPELAEEETKDIDFLVSAYGTENSKTSVYTFISPEDLPDGNLQMRLTCSVSGDGEEETQSDYIEPESYSEFLQRRRLTVRYLFLIDRSTSMPQYAEDVSAYIRAIMEQDEKNGIDAFYSIAGCGKKMEMVKSDLTDVEAVIETLKYMEYKEEETNLYSGVVNSLKMLNGQSLQPGSLTNLILITDGVPYIDSDKNAQELAEKARNKIGEYPEIVVHTLCLNEWEGDADEYLCVGTGCQDELQLVRNGNEDLSADDLAPASERGEKVSDFIRDLDLCVFEMNSVHAGDVVDLKVDYKYENYIEGTEIPKEKGSGTSNSFENVRILSISGSGMMMPADTDSGSSSGTVNDAEGTASDGASGDSGTASSGIMSSDAQEGSSGEESGSAVEGISSEGAEESAAAAGSGGEFADPSSAARDSTADQTAGEEENKDGKISGSNENSSAGSGETASESGSSLSYVFIGLAAAAAICALAFLLLKKNKKSKQEPVSDEPVPGDPAPGGKPGILIRIEVLKGTLLSEGDRFYLDKQLIIGRDPAQCDIVFSSNTVSHRHARLFIRDGMICIEDLGSTQGTYLGDTRLISSSRLKSGDQLKAGDTVFIAWF
ncbi:MAG: FHA domain-containing protein [Eubacteriales bacterium]|nr:FHA domain-containing protein [Eubacteriales bacterium]